VWCGVALPALPRVQDRPARRPFGRLTSRCPGWCPPCRLDADRGSCRAGPGRHNPCRNADRGRCRRRPDPVGSVQRRHRGLNRRGRRLEKTAHHTSGGFTGPRGRSPASRRDRVAGHHLGARNNPSLDSVHGHTFAFRGGLVTEIGSDLPNPVPFPPPGTPGQPVNVLRPAPPRGPRLFANSCLAPGPVAAETPCSDDPHRAPRGLRCRRRRSRACDADRPRLGRTRARKKAEGPALRAHRSSSPVPSARASRGATPVPSVPCVDRDKRGQTVQVWRSVLWRVVAPKRAFHPSSGDDRSKSQETT
jgi:hypothetical protein